MATEIAVEVFKTTKATRQEAQSGSIDRVWKSAYVVRLWNQATQEAVLGGGFCERVAFARAGELAIAKGWF